MANCLVSGGAGFIGGHLVDRLVANGHAVTVLDDGSSGHYRRRGVRNVHGNVCHMLPSGMFDVVFHLAAVSRTPPAVKDPLRCMEVNVNGTHRLLEAVKQRGIPRFVFASSNVVYAGPTAYKVSKLAAEGLCDVYHKLYGVSTVALRFSNVYGSRLRKGDVAVFSLLRDTYLSKGYVEVTGDGEQTRDWTHVFDIVDGLIAAWQNEVYGAIDLCTGSNTRLNDAIRLMGRSGSVEIPIRHIPERAGDVKHIAQDPSPAYRILNWRAKIALTEGIKDVWQI